MFKRASVKGYISIVTKSSTIKFPIGGTVKITDPFENNSKSVTNVTRIWIASHNQLVFNTSSIILYGSLDDGIQVSIDIDDFIFSGKASFLLIQLRNNTYIQYNDVNVAILAPKCTVLTSNLKILAKNSSSVLYEATTVMKLASIIKTRSWLNESLGVKGYIEMDVSYGGVPLVVKHFYYEGLIERYRGTNLYPKYGYNESNGLILAILVFLFFLLNRKNRTKEYKVQISSMTK